MTRATRVTAPHPAVVLARHAVTVRGSEGALPVVLGHGFGCDQSMWDRVEPGLRDLRTVTFDHVGCGASDLQAYDPVRHADLHGYAADLVELLDALQLGPVVFVGHSVSGMLGALAANARPDLVRGLVMLGSSPRYLDDGDYVGGQTPQDVEAFLGAMESNMVAWARATAPVVMGNPERPQLAEELSLSFARTPQATAVGFARAIMLSDHRADLAAIAVPTLVLQNTADAMVPDQVGHYLHERIAGSRFTQLDARGHYPHVSEPDEVVGALRRFLDAL